MSRLGVVIGEPSKEDGGYFGGIIMILPNEFTYESDVDSYIISNLPIERVVHYHGWDAVNQTVRDLVLGGTLPQEAVDGDFSLEDMDSIFIPEDVRNIVVTFNKTMCDVSFTVVIKLEYEIMEIVHGD